jgi:hypothetical protein
MSVYRKIERDEWIKIQDIIDDYCDTAELTYEVRDFNKLALKEVYKSYKSIFGDDYETKLTRNPGEDDFLQIFPDDYYTKSLVLPELNGIDIFKPKSTDASNLYNVNIKRLYTEYVKFIRNGTVGNEPKGLYLVLYDPLTKKSGKASDGKDNAPHGNFYQPYGLQTDSDDKKIKYAEYFDEEFNQLVKVPLGGNKTHIKVVTAVGPNQYVARYVRVPSSSIHLYDIDNLDTCKTYSKEECNGKRGYGYIKCNWKNDSCKADKKNVIK